MILDCSEYRDRAVRFWKIILLPIGQTFLGAISFHQRRRIGTCAANLDLFVKIFFFCVIIADAAALSDLNAEL